MLSPITDEDLEGEPIPNWADAIGWILSLIPIVMIVVFFFIPYSPPWCSEDATPPPVDSSNLDCKAGDHSSTEKTRPMSIENDT